MGGARRRSCRISRDSTLFPDYAARALLVIDPSGRVGRTLALPNPNDVGLVTRGSAIDPRGRLIYLGSRRAKQLGRTDATKFEDSLPILRAELDLRRTDTIGKIARPLTQDRRGLARWSVHRDGIRARPAADDRRMGSARRRIGRHRARP